MAEQGYSTDQIGVAIKAASPVLDERKSGHVEDWVERTVRAIFIRLDEVAPEEDSLTGPS